VVQLDGPPEPPEEHEAGVQAREEREVLEEAAEETEPPEFFEPCEPVASTLGVSSYHCTPEQLDIETAFFATKDDAEQALFDRAGEVEAVESEAACPSEAPAVQPFQLEEGGETVAGYLLCFIEFGQWHYAWTNTPGSEYRYSEATFPRPSARAAQKWWETSDEEAWRQLPIERVPARYGTCEAAYPEGEAVEAVSCLAGSVEIRLQFFDGWRKAQSYFQEKVLAISPDPRGRCAEAVPAQDHFTYTDQEETPASGRLLCFVRQGGLVYDWFKPTLRLYGEAEFESADPQAAESWWRGG
jgi:hypothetical protein